MKILDKFKFNLIFALFLGYSFADMTILYAQESYENN